jgi:predicted ATPase
MLRAVRRLLDRVAAARPLVLALDDVHWADAASLDLLCHLVHRGFEQPVLLLVASRPAQSPARFLAAIEEAERHDVGRQMELLPLSPGDADELLGGELDTPLRAALYRESGGNPFYLEQLAAAAQRGVAVGSRHGGAGAGVPAAVSAAIGGEIGSLSPPARSLLRAAAVLGDPFDPDLAADTVPVEEAVALEALDELVAHDLIRASGAPRQFRFSPSDPAAGGPRDGRSRMGVGSARASGGGAREAGRPGGRPRPPRRSLGPPGR